MKLKARTEALKAQFIKPVDKHNAARSGQYREQMLKQTIEQLGFDFVEKQMITDIPEHYQAMGFNYFWNDGSIPKLNIDHIELKGGSEPGTTQEKLFFDLLKIRDGVYKGNLLYIFEGIMETDKCTKLFIHELNKMNLDNVSVVMFSDLDAKVLKEVFA